MNIAQKAILTLCVLLIIATGAPLQAATMEESFRKNFPSHCDGGYGRHERSG